MRAGSVIALSGADSNGCYVERKAIIRNRSGEHLSHGPQRLHSAWHPLVQEVEVSCEPMYIARLAPPKQHRALECESFRKR